MWLMLQQEGPDDFVLATGHMHSVREFVVAAFRYIGKEIEWEGAGDTEVGKEKGSGVVRYKFFEYLCCSVCQIQVFRVRIRMNCDRKSPNFDYLFNFASVFLKT
jgi:GDP-D-mannose dehydratase